jgi:hypothetical protein
LWDAPQAAQQEGRQWQGLLQLTARTGGLHKAFVAMHVLHMYMYMSMSMHLYVSVQA